MPLQAKWKQIFVLAIKCFFKEKQLWQLRNLLHQSSRLNSMFLKITNTTFHLSLINKPNRESLIELISYTKLTLIHPKCEILTHLSDLVPKCIYVSASVSELAMNLPKSILLLFWDLFY